MDNQKIIYCSHCGDQLQEGANFCSRCAAPVVQQSQGSFSNETRPSEKRMPTLSGFGVSQPPKQTVSILLGLGILFMPYIFAWFTLRKGYSSLARFLSFGWLALIILPQVSSLLNNKPTITEQSNSSALVYSNNTATATSPSPATLSSKENLEAGKNALSSGNLSSARGYLSAIPKEAKESASANQYLAVIERREKRKAVEDELEKVKRDEATAEDTMNRTEGMLDSEGTIGKQVYAGALKRKAELQLQRIKLERKLKSMP